MLLTLLACTGATVDDTGPPALPAPLTAAQLDAFDFRNVEAVVDELGADSYAGRTPGSIGHAAGVEWLEVQMAQVGLEPAGQDGSYLATFPLSFGGTRYAPDATGEIVVIEATEGTNLGGLISGSDLSDELIVLMAHHDHLGTTEDGDVFNGAYDDLSGVGLLLELARLYRDEGIQPRRSILFLITDAEESGLAGAHAWVDQAPWPLDEVVAAFSVDPIGRPLLPDSWPMVLMGLERAPELKAVWQDMARSWSDAPVHFVNRDTVPIFASDQDAFFDGPMPVPAAWVTSPGFTWYHTTGDTPETIDYRSIVDHGRFLAQAILHLAELDTRWVDDGLQPMTAQDAADAAAMVETLLLSTELLDHERSTMGWHLEQFQDYAAQGPDIDVTGARTLVAESLLYMLDDLAQAHPGQVPPPRPD